MEGIINFLKPPGMTSHDIVALTRRKLGIKKVGHTGTLDPMAAGVLPVCIGKATKVIEYIQEDKKKYRAEMVIGQETDTQDRWGQVINEKFIDIDQTQLYEAILSFKGEIDQTPPMYSALKVNGKKLYELAREGIVIERQSRKRTIFDIKPIYVNAHKVMIDVCCSKGTYIRTLCHDIGLKLESYGHMSFLLRTATGCFNLDNAVTIEAFENATVEQIKSQYLMTIEMPFMELPTLEIPNFVEVKIMHGQPVDLNRYLKQSEEGQMYKVCSGASFIGLAKMQNGSMELLKRLK